MKENRFLDSFFILTVGKTDLCYLTYFLERTKHFLLNIQYIFILKFDVTRSNISVAIGNRTPGFRSLSAVEDILFKIHKISAHFPLISSLLIKMEVKNHNIDYG